MASATSTLYEMAPFRFATSANGIAQITANNDTFRIMLLTSADAFVNEHSVMAQISGKEISHQNYPAGGIALAGVTFNVASSGTATLDASDVIVTASGSDLSAQSLAVFASRTSAERSPLICHVDFGGTQTAGAGTNFTITWSADGIVQVRG